MPDTSTSFDQEKQDAAILAQKYLVPLKENADTQKGWGVTAGSALNGSFARDGREGFFVRATGKMVYLKQFETLKRFLSRHAAGGKLSNLLLFKGGIGGQHTGYQGLAESFSAELKKNKVTVHGEYELGYSPEDLEERVTQWGYSWDRVLFIASSKSGSTDESMIIFAQYLGLLLKHASQLPATDGQRLADSVQNVFRELNYDSQGKEKPTAELFQFKPDVFFKKVVDLTGLAEPVVKKALEQALIRIAIETTPNAAQSRLAAFAQNAGLYQALGIEPPVVDMFDNVGGRWTIDFHMLPFLVLLGVDPADYWNERDRTIQEYESQGEKHSARVVGHRLLDENVRDIILVTPPKTPWLGHTIEQTFNESIYANGYIHLRAIPQDEFVLSEYSGKAGFLVVNVADAKVTAPNAVNLDFSGLESSDARTKTLALARLFTAFYGITNTVGFRLIARALTAKGRKAEEVDINKASSEATQIAIANSHLLQPWVEWAKKSVEKLLGDLQSEKGGIERREKEIGEAAGRYAYQTNFAGDATPLKSLVGKDPAQTSDQLAQAFSEARDLARRENRRLIVWLYAHGNAYAELHEHFNQLGAEVWQGTSMQHISANQLHSQAQDFLPFIVSVIPAELPEGPVAMGFGKAYLHKVPTALVRDAFAEGTYGVPTKLRKEVNGKAAFLRIPATEAGLQLLKDAGRRGLSEPEPLTR